MTYSADETERASPHDALFKRTFEQTEQAIGLIRALLPPEATAQFGADTLEVVPGTFIDAELRDLESDLSQDTVIGFFREQLHIDEDVMSAAEEKFYERMAPFLLEAERRDARAAGLEEARQALVTTVCAMLTRRFGVLSSDSQSRVQSAAFDELQQMLTRVLDASSVDEVIG